MILGPLRFPNIAVVAISDEDGWDYAAHSVIENVERRQFVAKRGKPITLSLKLHAEWMDPQETLDELRELADAHEVLTLQSISGRLLGQFVIEGISSKPLFILPDGFIVSMSVDVKLVDPGLEESVPLPEPVAVMGTLIVTTTSVKEEDTSTPKDEVTPQQIARL